MNKLNFILGGEQAEEVGRERVNLNRPGFFNLSEEQQLFLLTMNSIIVTRFALKSCIILLLLCGQEYLEKLDASLSSIRDSL